MNPTPTPPVTVSDVQAAAVLDAIRDIASDQDGWRLADVLVATVPNGVKPFADLLKRAQDAGIAGKLKVDTLRLYRDTAKHWPADQRVPGVSFSAHREAERLNDVDAAVKLLRDLAATSSGAANVTVTAVRSAVAVKRGHTPKPANAPRTTTAPVAAAAGGSPWPIVLEDLRTGAPELCKALDKSGINLDALHGGLSKALAVVEARRSKAAAKARKQAAPASPAPAPATTASPQPDLAGDIRGL